MVSDTDMFGLAILRSWNVERPAFAKEPVIDASLSGCIY